jgi:hypothetical protein
VKVSATVVTLLLSATARAQDPWTSPPPRAYPSAPPAPLSPPDGVQSYPPRPPAPLSLPEGAHFASDGEVCYPAPPPGQTHDGFYLRLQIGAAYVSAQQGATTFTGFGMGIGFSLGAIILPDLALFGSFVSHFAYSPKVRGDVTSTSIGRGTLENDSFGAGLVYYLPVNVYAAAAVMGTSVDILDVNDNRLRGSNVGVGFDVTIGKEWWVGREWGLGAAGEITGAWMSDRDDASIRWNSFSYSLLFSATYN